MRPLFCFRPSERGFTLIELIVAMVVIALLAATAIPKYFDLSNDAKTAALKGAATAITSASSTNYALMKGGAAAAQAISDCASAANLAQIPGDMSVTAGTTAPAPGVTGDCNINYNTNPLSTPYNFLVLGA